MPIGLIIQARSSSTRLPGKVLLKLPENGPTTVLAHVIKRCQQASVDQVIMATTTDPEDDELVGIAHNLGAGVFRGSRDDVLARYFLAAEQAGLDRVVRVTSDCPCVDPAIIDNLIRLQQEKSADYASNSLIRSFPHGLDVEVFTMAALTKAHENADSKYDREHVTPYIYRTHPERFRIEAMLAPPEWTGPDIRITLDKAEDYTLLCAIFDLLAPDGEALFTGWEIVQLFQQRPWLKRINSQVMQKTVYDSPEAELAAAVKMLKLQELPHAVAILEKSLAETIPPSC